MNIHLFPEIIGKWVNYIAGAVFPDKCALCAKTGSFICQKCKNLLPAELHIRDKWIISALPYKNPGVRTLLWNFKYRGRKDIGSFLLGKAREAMMEYLEEILLFEGSKRILFIPIPATEKRIRKRGFDHAGFLSESWQKFFPDSQAVKLITKTKETKTQAKTPSKKVRGLNIAGSFEASEINLLGACVFIVDDIVTTGETLREARRALEKQNAASVYAITISHAD